MGVLRFWFCGLVGFSLP